MKVLPIETLAAVLVCPMCRGGTLVVGAGALTCGSCAHRYGTDYGVVSFLVPEELSDTNRGEIKANAFDPADVSRVERILEKEDWNPLITHQMKWVIETIDAMLPQGRDLYALGTGSGFDLRLLLRRRSFPRVFASDISPSATALVARALETYSGELGLFASEFGRCPVPKRPGAVGLVFQALHHAPDAHAALAALLDHNFDELVIVEPVTNPPLGLLAKFDLVQRIEYSGTRPDWLALPKVGAIASERGYKVESRTWWEVPPYFAGPRIVRDERVWRAMFRMFDVVSNVTNVIRFGSMAAIHLKRA